MRALLKATAALTLTGALLAVPLSAASAADKGRDLTILGLSDGRKIVEFRSDDTGIRSTRAVTGLTGDALLVGIDHRVQDGKLYSVGDKGGLYTIDKKATATKVGALTVPLAGTSFGVDFNPAANSLRVVSDTGQNLRQPFATTPLAATVADTPLTNPAVAPATGTVPATGVTAAAYTNNDLDAATATTLFDIDTTADRVAIQSPANAGTLAPTGGLGVDAGSNAGLDIYSTVRGGKATSVQAFATLQVGGRYALYTVDLLTGATDRVGNLSGAVSDVAIPLQQR